MSKAIEQGMEVVIGGDFNDEHGPGTRIKETLGGLLMVNIISPPGETTPASYQ